MFKPVPQNPDFPALERELLDSWYRNGTVKRYLKKNLRSKKNFSFQDGPITANNPMGVHHAWGRSYKDLWQKFFNLLGYRQRFNDGFDCQGLWVEVEVEKELGLRFKKDIENLVPGNKKASIEKFVQLCKDRVVKFSGIQTEQSKRLGYFMDWDNPYFTMSDENNYMIWHFLKKCYEYGWIYKGRDSVPWCPRCETAISQHEMLTEDYKEAVHESVYLKLPIEGRNNEFLLVWTTTPWTIPANIAVAVEKKFDYSLVEMENEELYWVAQELVSSVFGKNYKKITKTIKGEKLVGLKYKGPFDSLPAVLKVAGDNKEKFHSVVATDERIMPITLNEGTGLVHTAVSAGTEDFELGKKLGLPMIPIIADNADYLGDLDFLSGKNAKKHPELILDYLRANNWAYKTHHYKHRYPACWRCKTELVWKVADEWYIAMDKPISSQAKAPNVSSHGKTFREMMINVTKKIKWLPEFGLDRELDWLNNMHDWLISKKNRYWGLALPIYECKKCERFEVIGSKQELKERAVAGWGDFDGKTPHKPYIDDVKINCSRCDETVSRIDDVGNPWLDAGIVPFSTIKSENNGEPLYTKNRKEWKEWFPVDFITESFPGQFKNWFYALIAMSTALEDSPPFKTVLGFATLVGEDGRPMHKSWGNAIEFNEGADKIGVDVMRWMYARQNPSDNMLFGYRKADEVRRQFYLILWNTYRYFVEYAILDNYNLAETNFQDKVVSGNVLDVWITNRLYWLTDFVKSSLKEFNAKEAIVAVEKFVDDLSTWYIRRSRDRVWVNSEDKIDKEMFYITLHGILKDLAIIISPIAPFIADLIYTNITRAESVHLETWPERGKKIDPDIIEDMSLIREICEVGHRGRKEHLIKIRQILGGAVIDIPKKTRFKKTAYEADYRKIIIDELNVKDITLNYIDGAEINVSYDLTITDDLRVEGEVRDLIRLIQKKRKELGLEARDVIDLEIKSCPVEYEAYIKKRALIRNIELGTEFKISKVS